MVQAALRLISWPLSQHSAQQAIWQCITIHQAPSSMRSMATRTVPSPGTQAALAKPRATGAGALLGAAAAPCQRSTHIRCQ